MSFVIASILKGSADLQALIERFAKKKLVGLLKATYPSLKLDLNQC